MMNRREWMMITAAGSAEGEKAIQQAEVIIYGATPGGIAAAVSAARMGHSVLLCEYEDHIGGIVSNGLTNADIGKRQAVGGIFYEFTRRVLRYYQEQDKDDPEKTNVKLCHDGYWYEADVAEQIFHDLIREAGGRVRLLLSHELKQALVEKNRLKGIVLEERGRPGSRIPVSGSVFIDATYEGDLAAMAGAPFRTGRESRSEYNEPHAGHIYMVFGTTRPLPGSTGEGDQATQAYCFRFHVTNDPAKRVPIGKPEGYRREDYHWVLEDIRSGRARKFRDIIQVYAMPNRRFELNSDHPHPDTGVPRESLDLAEDCWDWPTATPERRRAIYQRYKTHNTGLIWLLQNDPEVPAPMREDACQWGWHRDLWPSNGHIPRQVYVRQGRRILGEAILTENDARLDEGWQRTALRKDSVAVLEWAFDPHGHHRYDPEHPGVREGYFFVDHPPFQVPYGVLVPRKIDGLLVPVSCSCSHVAYNALRLEPVFMALGEVCGLAAHLAVKKSVEVRRVPVPELQQLLVERKGVITFFEDLPFDDPAFAAFQYLGARGLNPGYRADGNKPLRRGEGSGCLARILKAEGKTWQTPRNDTDSPLRSAELFRWLNEAGYPMPDEPDGPVDLSRFAMTVHRAIRSRAATR